MKFLSLNKIKIRLTDERLNHILTSHPEISEHVWNEDFDSLTNVIDVFINRLRNKVDRGFKKKLIQSLRGTGYILKE